MVALECSLCTVHWDEVQTLFLSPYDMKNIFCLFEGHFKIQKNGVFLFQISFFVLEILTKLDSTIKDNGIHLPGYDVVRKDRENNGRHGGGVCI